MSKNLLQDIVRVKREKKEQEIYPAKNATADPIEPISPTIQSNSNSGSRYGLWFVALISIVFLLFAFSYLFSGAKVTINPKMQDLSLNENLSAIKNSNAGGLSFDLVVISGEENKEIQGGEEKDVSDKAKGVVIIYNSFGISSQALSVNTRLEGSNGKIYKTDAKITVPGMAQNETPGSVEVGIYAENAGEEYNSDPLDFKILGFKGTSKYTKIYARSKGKIEGGLKGKVRQISDIEKTDTLNELKTTLQAKLFKKVADQIPDGFILFKDAAFLNVDEETILPASTEGMVPINIKGTFYGFLFDEKKLTKEIIKTNVDKYDGSEVYIPNIKDLSFSLPTGQAGLSNKEISFNDVKEISFNLSGASKIVWKIDTEKLITDLLGKRKKDFNQVLSQYSNIDSADLVIKPAWKMSFPDKTKDINIIVNYPE